MPDQPIIDEGQNEIPPLTDGTIVDRINKKDLQPAFDGNHEHQYVPDEEETDDYRAEVCSLKGCWMGRLVAKH